MHSFITGIRDDILLMDWFSNVLKDSRKPTVCRLNSPWRVPTAWMDKRSLVASYKKLPQYLHVNKKLRWRHKYKNSFREECLNWNLRFKKMKRTEPWIGQLGRWLSSHGSLLYYLYFKKSKDFSIKWLTRWEEVRNIEEYSRGNDLESARKMTAVAPN